jgi:hypothetical protein
MEDRISAVQQGLLLLLVASLALGLVARPHPENRSYTGALQELSAFQAAFDRNGAEALLRAEAEAQGLVPLAGLRASALKGGASPALALAAESPPIKPWTRTRLATLDEIRAMAQPNSKLSIGVPDLDALGAALGWRLARLEKPDELTLRAVELATAEVSPEDVAHEQQTAALRRAQVAAATEVGSAERRLEQDTNMLEARRRNGASWKVVLKAMETQKEATDTLAAKKEALSAAMQAYESAVQAAERKHAPNQPAAPPTTALARVTLSHNGAPLTLEIPVALALREVPVTSLGATFEATRAAGLWDEVKTLDVAGAIAAVQGHFNWHNRSVDVGGLKLSGALALHVLPCILPLLLMLVSARVQRVSKSYSPFSTKVPDTVPRVGFRSRVFDFIVIVLLPSLTALSAALSLYMIGQPPLLPVGVTILCAVLGSTAFGKLGELQNLLESVVHSHSYPPPQRS